MPHPLSRSWSGPPIMALVKTVWKTLGSLVSRSSVREYRRLASAHLLCGRLLQLRQCSHSVHRPNAVTALSVRGVRALCSASGAQLVVSDDGQRLSVCWPDGEESQHYVAWLRHSCQCPECWDPTAHQTMVYLDQLQGDMRVQHARDSGNGAVELCWSYDTAERQHTGYIDLQWLRKNSHFPKALEEKYKKSRPPVAESLPRMSYSEVEESDAGLWRWLRNVNEFGVCLITDVPTVPGFVKKLADSAGGVMETYYGETYNVVAKEQAINLAFTTDALPLHMDMVNLEAPPGLQFLHCMRNDDCVEGGMSALVDVYAVLEGMKQEFPTHFMALSQIPATFQRVQRKSNGELVDHVCRRPHITLNEKEEVSAIYWNPGIQGTLLASVEDAERYYKAMICFYNTLNSSKLRLSHRLQPGHVLTFNNRRMVHTRTKFQLNGGVRHLEGVYVNNDMYISRFRQLAAVYGQGYTAKMFFNNDTA